MIEELKTTNARLSNRTAIVTGAGAGIGAAIVECFVSEGAYVICLDVNANTAETIADRYAGSALALEVDVTDEKAVEAAIYSVIEARGQLDILVNNAGIAGPQHPAHTTPVGEWRQALEVNLTGPFLMSKFSIPHLQKQRGCIVNIASALALVGWRNECAYGPGKAGIVQLTKGMALDYAETLRVNCVCPGAVRTPMIESVLPSGEDVEALMAEYGKIHPLYQRLAWPVEIANAVLFLASDDASLVTGVAMPVDGGFTAG